MTTHTNNNDTATPITGGRLDPYSTLTWSRRDAVFNPGTPNERVVQSQVEFPTTWSDRAVAIVTDKYFRGNKGTPQREHSLRQVIDRIADTITLHGIAQGHLSADAAERFRYDLKHLLVHQKMAFNSPVWFNTGVLAAVRAADPDDVLGRDTPLAAPGLPPVGQASACFILGINDSLPAISKWMACETRIFQGGSGSGVNLSSLREDGALLSGGGTASGPMSYARAADQNAGSIKSGGTTRRAAKMVILNINHPDVLEFIRAKSTEEGIVRALHGAGYDMSSMNNPTYRSVGFQNTNHSVRVTDAFMRAVDEDAPFTLESPHTGATTQVNARDLYREICQAAWECADPGIQYDDTIQAWHTTPDAGRINGSNPCSEYMSLDNSACNLASLNILAFISDPGVFDTAGFTQACQTATTAMDILVSPATYPLPEIGDNARRYRQLGLGYANLGAALMCMGLPYDSDEGRAFAGAVTALMHAAATHQSTLLAANLGPYDGYEPANHETVLDRHHRAMEKLAGALIATDPQAPATGIAQAALSLMGSAVGRARTHGMRNAQSTVLAPTGTISFAMDCDTTGIEPAAALVATKALAGGGTMTLVVECVDRSLRALGYDAVTRQAISDHITTTGTAVGAPGLDAPDAAVFATAFGPDPAECISPMGHLQMMAACQPFISGAISKTVNMPATASVEDIAGIYRAGHELGLKALAVYRDGSKGAQPLTTDKKDDTTTPASMPVEASDEAGARRELPATRTSVTHKFRIGGRSGYLIIGQYEDGTPGEVFVRFDKQGSTVSGLVDANAQLLSLALQHRVPLATLVRRFHCSRFEPAGFTDNPMIPAATSVMDYIVRFLAATYMGRGDAEAVGVRFPEDPQEVLPGLEAPAPAIEGTLDMATEATGQVCTSCSGANLQRAGACMVCRDCGTTTGCG